MRKVAHLEDNKIVNIVNYDEAPKGKNFLDVTDLRANIGDTVVRKTVVSKDAAIKSLQEAIDHCLSQSRRYASESDNDCVDNQFFLKSLPELYAAYELMGDSPVVTMKTDVGEIRQYSRSELLKTMRDLFDVRTSYYKTVANHQQAIQDAKSFKELYELCPTWLSDHMVHPEAK